MWICLGILGIALAVLVATDASGGIGGLDSGQIAGLASLASLLLLFGTGWWRRFRDGGGESLRSLLIWVGLFALAIGGYTYRDAARSVGQSLLGALVPGTAAVGPGGEVTITRRSDGDFAVQAEVNGMRALRFSLDTGASVVVLTAEGAAALGIRPADSAFNARVATANGSARAAPIRLDTIRIGPITEHDIDAMVSRPGALSTNLLGQSFLTRLPSYEVRGDRLILRSR